VLFPELGGRELVNLYGVDDFVDSTPLLLANTHAAHEVGEAFIA
jgi:hypothetical protein